jgi:maltose/maltodextrin transport system permease protein
MGIVQSKTKQSKPWKYLLPALLSMGGFILIPLLYTLWLSTSNYSSSHLQSQANAREYLLSQAVIDGDKAYPYELTKNATQYQIRLFAPGTDLSESAQAHAVSVMQTNPFDLSQIKVDQSIAVLAKTANTAEPANPLSLRERVQLRDTLMNIRLALPDGTALRYAGLREFAPHQPLYLSDTNDGALTDTATKKIYKPNATTGFFEDPTGERLQPGFRVNVGAANYIKLFSDPDIRAPFISIFIWNLCFALLTVLFTTALGLGLAVLLDWPRLKFSKVYRVLLFLPYAVPGFISILVFKGLFNQNFGEINGILNALFGIRPAWFADPWLAKAMLLIVNTWLGYPYIMILCSGLLKSISADLYEASAIAGAKPLTNLFKITIPLIIKPLTPLLIAAFAFNFNNFVLIALLTEGPIPIGLRFKMRDKTLALQPQSQHSFLF